MLVDFTRGLGMNYFSFFKKYSHYIFVSPAYVREPFDFKGIIRGSHFQSKNTQLNLSKIYANFNCQIRRAFFILITPFFGTVSFLKVCPIFVSYFQSFDKKFLIRDKSLLMFDCSIWNSKFESQRPRTDLNKRFLPRTKTTPAWKLIPHT